MATSKSPTPGQAIAVSADVRTGHAISVSADVRTEVFGDQHRDLAQWMHIDLSPSPNVRTERAVQSYNMATLHMVEAGLLLASVHAEVSPEAFAAALESRGMAKERAYELMRGAALIARLPPAQREQVIALSKSKVLALAGVSAAAVQAALEDDDLDIDLISVRQLKQRIRDLEAGATDLAVQRDTAEAEAEGLRKRLAKLPGERDDKLPVVVADLRAELMALGKKASLAIDGFAPLGTDLVALCCTDAGQTWGDATLRLAVAQLQALQVQLQGLLQKYRTAFADQDAAPVPASYLTQQEMREAAATFDMLTQSHSYEARLREWQREQALPKGKGRPKAKPVAPGGQA